MGMDSRYSAMARPLDFRYRTNAAIAVIAIVAGGVFLFLRLISGQAFLDSLLDGAYAFLIVFLTWAIAREFDPDYNASAFLATGFSILSLISILFTEGDFSVLGLACMLFGARILVRTVGNPATAYDSGVFMLLAGFLVIRGDWIWGITAAIVFILDGVLARPNRNQFLFAIGTIIFLILMLISDGFAAVQPLSIPLTIVILVVSFISLLNMFALESIKSTDDETGEALDVGRVQLARAIGLLTAVLFAVFYGDSGVIRLLPLWAIFLGIICCPIYDFLSDRYLRAQAEANG